jgi:preprotein translocase subunit SecG
MSFIVGILTFAMVINCLALILLVLVQLPKKDAGAGIAFGGGTADALFGAGSGNVLTKITKYATVALIALAVLLGYLQDKVHGGNSPSNFEKMVDQQQTQKTIGAPPAQPATPPTTQPANNVLGNLPEATNAPAAK